MIISRQYVPKILIPYLPLTLYIMSTDSSSRFVIQNLCPIFYTPDSI